LIKRLHDFNFISCWWNFLCHKTDFVLEWQSSFIWISIYFSLKLLRVDLFVILTYFFLCSFHPPAQIFPLPNSHWASPSASCFHIELKSVLPQMHRVHCNNLDWDWHELSGFGVWQYFPAFKEEQYLFFYDNVLLLLFHMHTTTSVNKVFDCSFVWQFMSILLQHLFFHNNHFPSFANKLTAIKSAS